MPVECPSSRTERLTCLLINHKHASCRIHIQVVDPCYQQRIRKKLDRLRLLEEFEIKGRSLCSYM